MAQFFTATFDGFIDRKGIGDALDKKERRVLARAGGYSRSTMRRGMRRRRGAGQEGGFPNAHSGELRDLIYFNYDPKEGSVSIGPLRFRNQPSWLPSGVETVPQLINEGGIVRRKIAGKLRTRRYRKRPFVELTRQKAAPKLVEIYKQTPLRS